VSGFNRTIATSKLVFGRSDALGPQIHLRRRTMVRGVIKHEHQQLEARHLGHALVGDDDRDVLLLEQLERLGTAPRGDDVEHLAEVEAEGVEVVLFVVDDDICIDAGVDGNEARYINHSCDANCETIIEDGRVFIDAIRDIRPGEELGYDYQLTWESTDDPKELALYVCRCGSTQCRGTMLDPVPLDRKRKQGRRRKQLRRRRR